MLFLRSACMLMAVAAIGACTSELPDEVSQSDLGEFRLDRLVVIVDGPEQMPFSRQIEDEALEIALTQAVDQRLRRFDGDQLYSVGINLQGYSLAAPGIPVLAAPRSLLAMSVNVYDDRPVRLNRSPKRLVVTEDAGTDTVVGSGFTQSAEEQLSELVDNAAIEIERWLRDNPQWFEPKPSDEGPALSRG